MKLEISDQLDN